MTDALAQQFALPVTLPDDETFESFFSGGNEETVAALSSILDSQTTHNNHFRYYFLSGQQNTGKSHLLYATCVKAHEMGLSNILLSMGQLHAHGADILTGLEHYDVVCIDDVSYIAGSAAWEKALFNFFNVFNEPQKRLILSDRKKPRELPIQLPDLASRLQWGVVYSLRSLTDENKIAALVGRAKLRGLTLTDDAASYLLNRVSRDMMSLIDQLDALDKASMTHQRKLTIPFLKQVLDL